MKGAEAKGPLLLSHEADRRTVVFSLVAAAVVASALLLPLSPLSAVVYIPIAASFGYATCAVNHNHLHVPLFRAPSHNALFGCLLTLVTGHPASSVAHSHRRNHHVMAGRPGDWIGPGVAGSTRGLRRLSWFVIAAPLAIRRGSRAPGAPAIDVDVRRRVRVERVVWLAAVGAFLVLAPVPFLVFVLPAWLIALSLFVGVNLVQHDGCDPESALNHSRNFLSPLTNWLFFNSGYHTAHHLHPSAHWSELPGLHQRDVVGRIDPRLEQRSVLAFVISHYVLSGGAEPP